MKNEITFLIGAGCETGKIYGLPSGKGFKQDIIKNNNLREIFSIFNKDSSIFIDNQKILKYNASSTLYQTIKENYNEYNELITTKKIDEEDKRIINEYLQYKSNINIHKNDKITSEFKNLYNTKIYNQIITDNKDSNLALLNFYLENLSFCSYVDSYFNYLRNVDLYTKECSRVAKMYFSAFQTIIFNIGSIKDKIHLIENNEVMIRRSQFIEILNKEFELLLNNPEKSKSNYYELIKDFKYKYNLNLGLSENNNNNYINIITTNYTPIIQKVILQSDSKIAYVHGKLNLFENIYTKEIKELTEFKEDEIIMPYIMIPSGIKPIISPYQISEWNKAINFIDNSKYVIILGYGINSDDEHIITIMRNYIHSKKFIFFLYNYKDSDDLYKKEKDRIVNIFKNDTNFYFFKTQELNDVLNKILDNKKILSTI